MENTAVAEFASQAARYRWGTRGEIQDIIAGHQYDRCSHTRRDGLGEELITTPSKST